MRFCTCGRKQERDHYTLGKPWFHGCLDIDTTDQWRCKRKVMVNCDGLNEYDTMWQGMGRKI